MAKKCIEYGIHLVIPALNPCTSILSTVYYDSTIITVSLSTLYTEYGVKRYVLHLDSIHLGFNEVKFPIININTCVVENFVVIINKIDHSTKAENINTCTSGNPNTHFIKGGYSSAFVAVATGSPL